MKTKLVCALAAAAALATASAAVAGENAFPVPAVKAIRDAVKRTAVVELPAKAGEIVKATPKTARERTAIRIVRIFLERRQALASVLVGEVVRAAPEAGAAIVAEAIRLFSESAYSIAKAAIVAAPKQAALIVLRAAAAAPEKAKAISAGVRQAIPEQEPQLRAFFSALQSGERVEAADAIAVSVPIRIAGPGGNIVSHVENLFQDPVGNAGAPYLMFEGVTQAWPLTPTAINV